MDGTGIGPLRQLAADLPLNGRDDQPVVGIIGAVVGIIGIVCTILGMASVTTAIKIKNSIKADNGATVYQVQHMQQTVVNEKVNEEDIRSLLNNEIRTIVKEAMQQESALSPHEDSDKADTPLSAAPPRPKTVPPDSPEGNDESDICASVQPTA